MWLEQLLILIEHVGEWGYLIGFILATAEALAFVGFLVPGSIGIILLGFVASRGEISPLTLTLCCVIGATLGDAISFYLGRNGTALFSDTNRIFHTKHLAKGKRFFERHGYYSIFLGRFLGAIRAFIPYIAGMFRMDTRKFFIWNILSAIAWSASHVYGGYFFGSAWRSAERLSTRAGLFIISAGLFCVVVWYVVRFLGARAKKMMRFMQSVLHSIFGAVKTNEDVILLKKNHPTVSHFLIQRSSIKTFWGLPFTLLCVGFLYALLEFFGIVQSIAGAPAIAGADIRVENLLFAFRSGPATAFFLWITMLGSWQVALGALITATIILVAWRKDSFVIPLWVAVVGGTLAGFIGKHELHRARPSAVAIYLEQSFSFPSGHSIMAVVLYGFLAYIGARYARRWRNKIYVTSVGVLLIFLIGLSRLYVGVHYFSDVWGGYLLGFMWLAIGISLEQWIGHKAKTPQALHKIQSPAGAIIVTVCASVLFTVYFGVIGHDAISDVLSFRPSFTTSTINANNALDVFADGAPQYTETLLGNQQEPVSFIISAPNEQAFLSIFQKAGWYPAEQLSMRSILRLNIAYFTGKPYPTAPITPSFWNQEVNDFAFEKPTPKDNIAERHHARFWRTAYVTDEGDRVYVGTASLDLRIKWFVTHAISPNIDDERSTLLNDLVTGGSNMSYSTLQFVNPSLGKNFTGDTFFTDGKAVVIEVK